MHYADRLLNSPRVMSDAPTPASDVSALRRQATEACERAQELRRERERLRAEAAEVRPAALLHRAAVLRLRHLISALIAKPRQAS